MTFIVHTLDNPRTLYFRKPLGNLPIETLIGHEFTVCIPKGCVLSYKKDQDTADCV